MVPAHGTPGIPNDLRGLAGYLDALQTRTRQAYVAGQSLLEAPRRVAVPEYRTWALYTRFIRATFTTPTSLWSNASFSGSFSLKEWDVSRWRLERCSP